MRHSRSSALRPPRSKLHAFDRGRVKIEVRLENETVWLTQAHMAELFQTTIPNVSMHLRSVFAEGELHAAATVKEFLIVRQEGGRSVQRRVEFYNLDAIISVGYRVKSSEFEVRSSMFATSLIPHPSTFPTIDTTPKKWNHS